MTKQRAVRLWAIAAVSTVAVMLALAYAAVPLYNLFCKSTGYGGTTRVASAPSDQPLGREIEVRFDTNVAPGAPLEFSADKPTRTLRLGETALVFFHVRNLGPDPIQAVATYNVSPFKAGIYMRKLECFCFAPKIFQPGALVELPVVFFVDPRLAHDRNTKEVQQIALSYTYYVDPRAKSVRTAQASAPRAGPGRVVATP